MILQDIKEKTAALHAGLEGCELMSHFKNRTITLENYREILSRFYGFFIPLEKHLESFSYIPAFLPDYPSRKKSSLLHADYSLLARDSSASFCPHLPKIENLSQAFGCLYVLEGSTLGGRIISKILKDSLEIDASSGGAFFNGYGDETGEKWKLFCQALVRYSEHSNEDELIIEGANKTFLTLKNWLEAKNDGKY